MIVVEILLRKYPTMMFRERVAGIDTVLTVVANAGTILSVAGPGETSGKRREQDSRKKSLHFHISITG